ncbi:hypothetical protein FALBO_10110 [Fusarium albosuccineum]|uniref:F-box domain-containing protein n=1 Tax=Fusarium albosuccineum TaxID=1237068 RepID=A0A8H4L6L5_9HYPO|nr:hypothetical protein FALBO_10110 [Fusarium albosuccineum]
MLEKNGSRSFAPVSLLGHQLIRPQPNDGAPEVYTENDGWEKIQLSGVGTFTDIDSWIPEDAKKRYDDPNLDQDATMDVSVNMLSLNTILHPMPGFELAPFWGYGFHSACWDLLSTLFRPDLADLFYLCLSMRVTTNSILDWGHEYGGAVYTKYSYGRTPELHHRDLSNCVSEGLKCDPYNIAAIQHFFHSSVSQQDDRGEIPTSSDDHKIDGDIFNRLPPELLQEILLRLQSKDVVNLRKASPVFANLLLSETFWASRFQRGYEYHYIFESFESRPNSWKALYFSLRTLASNIPALVNRRRVWRLALQMEALLAQVSGFPCYGQPLKSYYEPAGELDTHTWHTATRAARGSKFSFTVGCRPLRTRTLYFQTGLQLRDLWVSFVVINGISFVSGLRFVELDGHISFLGYIHPDTQIRVEFSDTQYEHPYCISGWHLAIDPSGFKAIAVVTEDGTMSSWAGQPGHSPKWCLAGPDKGISAVKAEFDALKLISLSRDVSPGTSFSHGLLWRNSCLWDRDIPPDHVFFNGTYDAFPFEVNENIPSPFSTVMFGGPHGELLCQLVEVVVHIFDVDVFTGFEFVYTDPSKNQAVGLLGPYPDDMPRSKTPSDDFRLPMAIDGPAGERIEDVQFHDQRGRIYGMKIRTNRGREMLFPPRPDIQTDKLASIETSGSAIIGFYFVKNDVNNDSGPICRA